MMRCTPEKWHFSPLWRERTNAWPTCPFCAVIRDVHQKISTVQ
jgi:hypothetical protein